MGLPSLNPDLLPRVSPGPLSNLDGTIHGQAAWIPALGGVERKEHPAGNKLPPTGVLLGGLSFPLPAGAVSFESRPLRCSRLSVQAAGRLAEGTGS